MNPDEFYDPDLDLEGPPVVRHTCSNDPESSCHACYLELLLEP